MTNLKKRLNYYRRIFGAYLTPSTSQLTFWHDRPAMSEFVPGELGPYYMAFQQKADYAGPKDAEVFPSSIISVKSVSNITRLPLRNLDSVISTYT